MSAHLRLSIVIPTLNEAESLPLLLADLSAQKRISFEAVVVDGGSTDGTDKIASEGSFPFALMLVKSAPGRGRQMNLGAMEARSSELLFLHADTRIEDPTLLARGLECMERERKETPFMPVGGHFCLTFSPKLNEPSWYFYEAKTRLNRPETTNGDQGFWLATSHFNSIGGFDESLPFLEDSRLAQRLGRLGRWALLDGTLVTSARRFAEEGLYNRQTLNALIRCFDEIGFHEFFVRAREAYRVQEDTGQLELAPLFALAHRIAAQNSIPQYLKWWYKTGEYVRPNAWQLVFALDCARNRKVGFAPGDGPAKCMEWFERWWDRVTGNHLGSAGAMALTMAWFYGSLIKYRIFRR